MCQQATILMVSHGCTDGTNGMGSDQHGNGADTAAGGISAAAPMQLPGSCPAAAHRTTCNPAQGPGDTLLLPIFCGDNPESLLWHSRIPFSSLPWLTGPLPVRRSIRDCLTDKAPKLADHNLGTRKRLRLRVVEGPGNSWNAACVFSITACQHGAEVEEQMRMLGMQVAW